MENKYYLPKIEEFHIGFEYEVRQHEMQYGECVYGNEWETIDCEGNMFLQYIDISSGNIRVKYLDKEDIESLGFKLFENMPSRFHYNKYELDVDYLNVIRIEYDCNYIFKGKIKNKSELKKLLIQLEIINE